MPPTTFPLFDITDLRRSLKQKARSSEKTLRRHHPEAVAFFESKGVKPGKIREHAAKIVTGGLLAGALMMGAPIAEKFPQAIGPQVAFKTAQQIQQFIAQGVQSTLPGAVGPLTKNQEAQISRLIKDTWGIKATAELEGNRLNHSYGLIGAEQHLPRYPDDSLNQHGEYLQEGITPGLGGWGYFAYSKNQMTLDLIQKEKYYVAVQTLYLSDWNTRTAYLSNWYKYRKVLVINPANGKTIVGDVADAGPADWTGKHFGGSPEVMAYLGLNVGPQKGPVVLFFVDDPDNAIPLGPVEYNVLRGPLRIAQNNL